MGDSPQRSDAAETPGQTTQNDQLRTISFRMREIQRLMAIRVEQENRRLEAEGIDPVTETQFRTHPDED